MDAQTIGTHGPASTRPRGRHGACLARGQRSRRRRDRRGQAAFSRPPSVPAMAADAESSPAGGSGRRERPGGGQASRQEAGVGCLWGCTRRRRAREEHGRAAKQQSSKAAVRGWPSIIYRPPSGRRPDYPAPRTRGAQQRRTYTHTTASSAERQAKHTCARSGRVPAGLFLAIFCFLFWSRYIPTTYFSSLLPSFPFLLLHDGQRHPRFVPIATLLFRHTGGHLSSFALSFFCFY